MKQRHNILKQFIGKYLLKGCVYICLFEDCLQLQTINNSRVVWVEEINGEEFECFCDALLDSYLCADFPNFSYHVREAFENFKSVNNEA